MSIQFYQIDQVRENSTSPVSLFSLSVDMRQAQIYLKIANTSNAGALARVFHDASGSTFDETTALVWDLKILPGEFLEVDHIFMSILNPSGTIGYRTSVANALTATVYGIVDRL